MFLGENSHLTYCTNIHPGETWDEVFNSLKLYCITIKNKLSSNEPFGIGLRLSHKSATELLQGNQLNQFKEWLDSNNLYVFTMNGFPYGDFHNVIIKDQVHTPDWTTNERRNYTSNLIKILTYLLPENMEGGISTSPLSYKLWFKGKEDIEKVKINATQSLVKIVVQLVKVKETTGKLIHIDIEPEPDGVLENTQEVIDFYSQYLLNFGKSELQEILNCSSQEAKNHILDHIQLCYDVCHFALAYESPEDVISKLNNEGIKIGKIQISAALKCVKSEKDSIIDQQECLQQFDEPTYLHQATTRDQTGNLNHYSDLKEGIQAMNSKDFREIRTHFHVPVFISDFEILKSTQDDIILALDLWKKNKYSSHLEVETYTWGILPEHLQTDISSSIIRELEWVKNQLD